MHYSNTTELSLSQGKYKHKQNVNCLYSTELWSVRGRERALSQGVTHAPQEGVTWSTCSNRIFLNFKFSCQSTGTLGLQLQPCSRAWSSRAWSCSSASGPWVAPSTVALGTLDGAPACQVRAHTHSVTSNNLLVTREQSSSCRKDGAARDGSRAPRDGMGWRVLKQGRTKEGGCEKEKEANPSSDCWREWESETVTVRHSTTNY